MDCNSRHIRATIGERPTSDHSLDRIDNDSGYMTGNVRWATALEQSNNQRSNILVDIGNEKITVAAWCRKFGVPTSRIYYRLARGMDVETAIAIVPNRAIK